MPAFTPSTHNAEDVIAALGLQPLPEEGGWFRRTWEGGEPTSCSLIYALFTPGQFSALHRLRSLEVWAFHAGDPLECLRLDPAGAGSWVVLGAHGVSGPQWHDVVPPGVWQGARVRAGGRWALVTCAVVPAFNWEGFELGDRARLVEQYPEHAADIVALTRSSAERAIAGRGPPQVP